MLNSVDIENEVFETDNARYAAEQSHTEAASTPDDSHSTDQNLKEIDDISFQPNLVTF
tara:strand:+ start:346 stop:519 length:174 start_codon:yes stop_codon:yes gene_type:complete